jgi:hypothetical protein
LPARLPLDWPISGITSSFGVYLLTGVSVVFLIPMRQDGGQ